MHLLSGQIAAPFVVEVDHGALHSLPAVLDDPRLGGPDPASVCCITGGGVGARVRPHLESLLPGATVLEIAGGLRSSADRLVEEFASLEPSLAVGVGGGGTLDAVKFAAHRAGLPFVAVATNLAHDGIASPVAVLREGDDTVSHGAGMPAALVIDLTLVETAPPDHLRSGIGDVLSNLSAIEDWRLAHAERGEPIDGVAAALGLTGAKALLHRRVRAEDPRFLRTLADALILSGIAMGVAGTSRPASGACHEISHAIDQRFGGTARHGEQVAVGALFATHLRGSDQFVALARCLESHGLPRLPAELGLTTDQFAEAVALAPTTRPDRFTILEHRAMDGAEIEREIRAFHDRLR